MGYSYSVTNPCMESVDLEIGYIRRDFILRGAGLEKYLEVYEDTLAF